MGKSNIGATLSLKDGNFFANIKSAVSATDKLKSSLGGATKQLKSHSSMATKTGSSLKSLAGKVTGVVAAYASFSGVKNFLSDAITLANEQTSAEQRLQTTMSNVAGTTQEQINGIKAYASELQKITTVGDEVAISGASQLATFQLQSDTIKTLMPALSDLAVAQYGVSVSSDQMQSMANLVGKVMSGSTSALTRYGVVMNDAQKEILKTGTEAQKASTLVDVLGQNFGGLAEAMANTPEGRIQQLNNAWGDMKEVIGAQLYPALTQVLTYATDHIPAIQTAFSGVMKGVQPTLKWITGTALPAVGSGIGKVIKKGQEIYTACAPAIGNLKNAFGNLFNLITSGSSGGFLNGIADTIKGILPVAINAASGIINAVSGITGFISNHFGALQPIIAGIFGSVLVGKGINGVATFTESFSGVGGKLSLVKTAIQAVSGKDGIGGFIKSLGGVGKALTGVGSTIQNTGKITGALSSAFKGVGTAITFISNPIGLGVVAAGALVTAIVLIVKHWDKIKETASRVFGAVGNFAKGAVDTIKNFFGGIGEWFGEKFSGIKGIASTVFGGVGEVAGTVLGAAKDTISEKLNNIKTAYTEHGGGIKGIAAAAMEGVKGYYTAGYSFINNLTGGKLEEMRGKIGEKLETVKNNMAQKWENIKQTTSEKWTTLCSSVKDKVSGLWSTVTGIFDKIKDGIVGKIQWAKDKISGVVEGIKGIFRSIKDTVSGVWEGIKSKIKIPSIVKKGTISIAGFNTPIPKFGIEWHAKGGIMTRPTIFGMNGNNAMVGGEAGAEAVLPLKAFWDNLKKFTMNANNTHQPNITNNEFHIIINADGKSVDEIVDELVPKLKFRMANM